MPAIVTSMLIGSRRIAEQTIDVDGSGNVDLDAGPYYLRSADADLSLIDEFAAVVAAAHVDTITIWIGRDRLVRFTSPSAVSIDWTAGGTLLRDLLGFSGNLAGDTSHEADYISPLLWSGGWPVTRAVRPGVGGYDAPDDTTQVSADGQVVDTEHHNTQVRDEWLWGSVPAARVRVSEAIPLVQRGGTWDRFRQFVLTPNAKVLLHESITEDAASSTAITWDTARGPYQRRGALSGRYDRRLTNSNNLWDLGPLEVIQTAEYS
jgi:hypothetical protein